MKHLSPEFPESSQIEKKAANWIARVDRGLTSEEQDEYIEWLTEDPRHRGAVANYQWAWGEIDRLAGVQTVHHARIDPDLLAPVTEIEPKHGTLRNLIRWFAVVPIAAAFALTVYLAWPDREPAKLEVKPALELMARIEQRTLDDGSRIEINRGAEVEVAYSTAERRVYLKKGEANFDVAKDPNRPFIVNVAGVDVRAVGTIFSVKLTQEEVYVIVSEGKVNVRTTSSGFQTNETVSDSLLGIGQRAKVDLYSESPMVEVTTLSQSEFVDATLWQPRLLDFNSTPLHEIVDEFNNSNPIQVVLGDPSLEMFLLSSTFWSDNVEGFVRLLESSFGMKAEWAGSREIILRSPGSSTD